MESDHGENTRRQTDPDMENELDRNAADRHTIGYLDFDSQERDDAVDTRGNVPIWVYVHPDLGNEATERTLAELSSAGVWHEVKSMADLEDEGPILPADHEWPVVGPAMTGPNWTGYDADRMSAVTGTATTPAPLAVGSASSQTTPTANKSQAEIDAVALKQSDFSHISKSRSQAVTITLHGSKCLSTS